MSSENFNYDYRFNLILIGDSNVGKSCLHLRYLDDAFTPRYVATIGVDFTKTTMTVEGKTIKLQIWDTAGQERFRSVTRNYYHQANGIMVVYDVTNLESFQNVESWLEQIKGNGNHDGKILLVGNKCESTSKTVTTQMGQELAAQFELDFIETSAKNSINVTQAFTKLITLVLNKTVLEEESELGGGVLDINYKNDNKKRCC